MSDKRDELDTSVAEGIISAEQAAAIRAKRAAEAGKDEPFKLVSNFGDVFLCVGLLFVSWSRAAFIAMPGVEPMWVYIGFAIVFWLLAEFFVFGAKRKFPAVVSILLFVAMVYKAASLELGGLSWVQLVIGRLMPSGGQGGFGLSDNGMAHLGILTGALLLALLRFRQPILVLALGLCATLWAFAIARMYMAEAPARLVLAACGVTFLIVGFLLDLKDRARTGIYHEWALWLFVLGSPLTVHPLFIGLIGEQIGELRPSSLDAAMSIDMGSLIWTVAALAAGFALLGLLLDRRSLVASSLLYLSLVLTYATFRNGMGLSTAAAVVPLTIGIMVILLGVGWDHTRAILLKIVPFRSAFRPPDL